MKPLPDELALTFALHGKLARGGCMFVYTNYDYGVTRTAIRETRNAEWKQVFTREGVEGEFETYAELAKASNRPSMG